MVMDPVGVAVGLGAIMLAFKGVVDTVNLFEDIVARDNGQKHLAIKYYIERHRWQVWGDEMKAEDELNSPLLGIPKNNRMLIAGILAEIRATHDLAQAYSRKYAMLAPDNPGVTSDEEGFAIKGKLVSMTKKRRDDAPQKNRFLWAARDKMKFTEIVNRMESLIDGLYEVVPSDNSQALASALSTYLLPKLQDALSLAVLQQIDAPKDPLLILSARLKILNNQPESELAQQVVWHDLEKNFVADKIQQSSGRELGYLELQESLPQRIWIEWKIIKPNLNLEDAQKVFQRIEALSVLLTHANADEYRIPPALGLVEDSKYRQVTQGKSRKMGFVYSWPTNILPSSTQPRSLSSLMNPSDPPWLSIRFSLAYKLASAMSLLHASRWLHKSFRPDNIIFFLNQDSILTPPLLNEPFITGFEYARPESQASLEQRMTGKPDQDLYYHPDVNLHGFNRVRDIYSLGVVLLEIALWTPVALRISEDEDYDLNSMSPPQVRSYILDLTEELGAVVGLSYRDAVRVCLTGDFQLSTADEGTDLSRAFFTEVLKRLSFCRA